MVAGATDGPTGTDVGLLPSLVARELNSIGIRATCIEDRDAEYPARIVEVFSPGGTGPLKALRSITAANDGGRWVFETYGDPLPFEDVSAYGRGRAAGRFTSTMLYDFLAALHVPFRCGPAWSDVVVVRRMRPRWRRLGRNARDVASR